MQKSFCPFFIKSAVNFRSERFFRLVANGDGMLRAALGTAFLSADTNLIGIVNLSSCASLPPEIYRMLPPVVFIFFLF